MTPTFDEIKEQYASTFLNEKTGKWSDATQSKIPTDPVITFNGQMKVPRRIVAIEIRQGTSQISRKNNLRGFLVAMAAGR